MKTVNGFDINNYRYFRNNETGKIIKCTQRYLIDFISSLITENDIEYYAEAYTVKPYPIDKPLDINEYIRMQDDIVFVTDKVLKFIYLNHEYLPITEWLLKKMNSKTIVPESIFLCDRPKSVAEYNLEEVQEKSKMHIIDLCNIQNSQNLPILWQNEFQLATINNCNCIYVNGCYDIWLTIEKGERWSLSNPTVVALLTHQLKLNMFFNSTEILGEEKERIFEEEYKDNIPNTNIRYYKIKDKYNIKNRFFLIKSIDVFYPEYNCFNSYPVNLAGDLILCEYNLTNFDADGSIRYFAIQYKSEEGVEDIAAEQELLKIADRLPQEEALLRYAEDMEAYARHDKEQRTIEYVKKHQARYRKGTNRLLTPVEFMEQEEAKERQVLMLRLTKAIRHKISQEAKQEQ